MKRKGKNKENEVEWREDKEKRVRRRGVRREKCR